MANSYDEVPYPSLPVRRAHPSHLAAIARLFGMAPAPPRRCRVLELGCASGENLLALAVDFPESDFVGIDLSPRQIASGRAVVDELGLTNLDLRAMDLSEFGERHGTFDYIICHGVYSWVSRPVQDRILRIGVRHLAPNGVFFVSYNTYPGWHLRGLVRDMMAYHVREFADPVTKVAQARALLDFLLNATAPHESTYRHLLRDEAAILKSRDDGYLYHEHLEEVNEPFYFHQFVERVDQAGLQYLGDTDVASMMPTELSDEVASLLRGTSLLRQEQYLDFLRNRMFRGTLLCHGDVELNRHIESLRWSPCDVGLEQSFDASQTGVDSAGELVWETPAGRIRVASPITQSALRVLAEAWPGCVSFDALLNESRRRAADAGTAVDQNDSAHGLARDLLTLYFQKLVYVWEQAPGCVARAGECPQATPLARWQAGRGTVVFNRRHEALRLTALQAHLLALLDGTRNQVELRTQLQRDVAAGTVKVSDDSVGTPPAEDRFGQLLNTVLAELAQHALLIR